MSFIALAFYRFVPIENPHIEVEKQIAFFSTKNCVGRIYIAEEGINGQMSGSVIDVEAYIQWLKQDTRFESISFKAHPTEEQIFPRMTVKYRRQLVALDQKVDISLTAEHVSPLKWREMIENGTIYCSMCETNTNGPSRHFPPGVHSTFRKFQGISRLC